MPIRIPDKQKSAIKEFAKLPDDLFESFLATLRAAQPVISARRLSALIAKKISLPESSVLPIIAMLGSLHLVREQQSFSVDQTADSITSAAVNEELIRNDPSEVTKFKERLKQFLTLEKPLGVAAKATEIIYRHKNVFTSARVFTDIRPIFSAEDELKASAAVLVHSLEIITDTDGQAVSHYFALDVSDVRTLKRVLERAIQKERSLKQFLEHANLSLIGIEESDST